ncbi:hypothetical protein PVK06_039227 [Gossypium arboreum]|uniref:Uncharacterized protein n=1 Tax=Gossypium arboreum TaxID=29729 RepID=A0ABR0N2J5_GOSAR|nr:hypothetical protein PVK06_039227 [Gossypium arboreum]
MAERAAFEARERVERSMSHKFSTSRNSGIRTSFSSSAKTLEEKSMRDLLAQKEQVERNELLEIKDTDIDEDVTSTGQFEAQLKRARSVPARVFGLSRKFTSEISALPENHRVESSSSTNKKLTSKSKSIIHPLFSLFDVRRKKKPTAKPEFGRYIEYLKEGGMWDMNANMPVMYYK